MLIYMMDKDTEIIKSYDFIMKKNLKHINYKLFTSYKELLLEIEKNKPDKVILDLDNPYGSIALKKIKTQHNNIFVIGAASNNLKALDAIQNGCSNYIEKPIDKTLLLKAIKG